MLFEYIISRNLIFSTLFAVPLAGIIAGFVVDTALAAETTEAPKGVETLWQFRNKESSCTEWGDGCRICRRISQDEIICSNIGIACQIKEIKCQLRNDEAPPK
jgi:hypothetical protein